MIINAIAASASPRTEMARRPTAMANVTRHAMANERSTGRCMPVSST